MMGPLNKNNKISGAYFRSLQDSAATLFLTIIYLSSLEERRRRNVVENSRNFGGLDSRMKPLNILKRINKKNTFFIPVLLVGVASPEVAAAACSTLVVQLERSLAIWLQIKFK